jgi:hypothetical protein
MSFSLIESIYRDDRRAATKRLAPGNKGILTYEEPELLAMTAGNPTVSIIKRRSIEYCGRPGLEGRLRRCVQPFKLLHAFRTFHHTCHRRNTVDFEVARHIIGGLTLV